MILTLASVHALQSSPVPTTSTPTDWKRSCSSYTCTCSAACCDSVESCTRTGVSTLAHAAADRERVRAVRRHEEPAERDVRRERRRVAFYRATRP